MADRHAFLAVHGAVRVNEIDDALVLRVTQAADRLVIDGVTGLFCSPACATRYVCDRGVSRTAMPA